ncbi:MAG: carboxypeptidase-like regulatory domain-containing protein [Gemmatimonadetes bacterium]|nr:carboxypeptidase-like regulatory domain-containing protein [Gemmatimonadota bacterium]
MTRTATKKVLTVIALLVAHPIAGHGQTDGFTITGTVVDKSTGNPLQYAVVGLPGHKSWSLSDQNGVFTLTGLEGGPDRFVVLRRGYNYADHSVHLTGPMEFRVEMTPEDVSDPAGPGRVVGRVLDQESGQPIEGVTVALAPTAQQAETDSRGRFEITDVSPGALLLQARRVGYQPRVDTIVAFPEVTVDVELTLATAALPLDPITIVARSPFLEARGFYRRAGGSGWQANRSAIEAVDPRELERMFDRVAVVRVERDRFGGTVLTSRRGTRCVFGVFLDGIRAPGFDINTLPPDAVEALEVYQGLNIPPEYSHSCGVVLIWMRRPGREEFRNRNQP